MKETGVYIWQEKHLSPLFIIYKTASKKKGVSPWPTMTGLLEQVTSTGMTANTCAEHECMMSLSWTWSQKNYEEIKRGLQDRNWPVTGSRGQQKTMKIILPFNMTIYFENCFIRYTPTKHNIRRLACLSGTRSQYKTQGQKFRKPSWVNGT